MRRFLSEEQIRVTSWFVRSHHDMKSSTLRCIPPVTRIAVLSFVHGNMSGYSHVIDDMWGKESTLMQLAFIDYGSSLRAHLFFICRFYFTNKPRWSGFLTLYNWCTVTGYEKSSIIWRSISDVCRNWKCWFNSNVQGCSMPCMGSHTSSFPRSIELRSINKWASPVQYM